MRETFAIRRATASDAASMLPLIEQYWRFEGIAGFDPGRVAPQLERVLADARLGGGWIAVGADALAGYLLAVYVFSLEHLGMTAEIDEFFVLPRLRAQGAGARLLQAAEAEFVAAGCTNVSLQLGRNNAAARAFYLRQGYAERSGYELLDKPLRR